MRINIKMKDCAFTIDRAHRRVICVIKISRFFTVKGNAYGSMS